MWRISRNEPYRTNLQIAEHESSTNVRLIWSIKKKSIQGFLAGCTWPGCSERERILNLSFFHYPLSWHTQQQPERLQSVKRNELNAWSSGVHSDVFTWCVHLEEHTMIWQTLTVTERWWRRRGTGACVELVVDGLLSTTQSDIALRFWWLTELEYVTG